MIRRLLPVLAALALATAACGDNGATDDAAAATTSPAAPAETEAPATTSAEPAHVVASTTWTGALAALAGAEDVTVIAPTTVLHPPDYDPKPSDLLDAADADLVLYAEFESFAPRLVEAAGGEGEVFPVVLENTPAMIESEVMRIAAALGTEDVARTQLDAFLAEVAALGEDLAAQVPEPAPVVVSQVFMSYWADWAGLSSAGTYGPAPMTADELATLTELAPTVVFDNHHTPGGQALEAAGTPRIELVNYPGADLDLVAVFEQNHDLIAAALAGDVTADPDVAVPEGGHDHAHGDAESSGEDAHAHEASGDDAHAHEASGEDAHAEGAVDATALHELADELAAGTLDADVQRAVVATQVEALGSPEAGSPAAALLDVLVVLDAALEAGDVDAAAEAAAAAHDAAHDLEHHG